ncbi:phage protein [Streptococcus cristatus]|uniref:Uncharacterized protein n=2 Tax=Streptococcus cristatus TaxID=45634 RepID=A0A512AAU9_STRCR|nr:hypothetical protein [Streptococcus cristatus]AGK70691.1 hypothetical protein I872_02930 [Streptococcus cristatus AS 1.3089]QBX09453.1 hypothetical protein JavanS342_0011 [Streptococcus satellite phage Javan342]GEN96830.1 hypothetical protein SOL01_07040 [Streptococcus cristatus]SQI46602.1 phage protein [Streptococcus cristatus]
MTNTKNLIPVTKRTRQEQIAISRKGGKVSGEARRKKAHLRKTLDELLIMDVSDERLKQKLEEMGLHADNQTLLCVIMLEKAIKGNVRAAEWIANIIGAYKKDKLDIQEQKERIKFLRHQNKKQETLIGEIEQPLIIVDKWASEYDAVEIDLGDIDDKEEN